MTAGIARSDSRPLVVELVQNGPALALEAVERPKPIDANTPSLDERVMAALPKPEGPLPLPPARRRRSGCHHHERAAACCRGRIVKTVDG